MRIELRTLALALGIVGACSVIHGAARDEVRIDRDRDAKRNTIYRLVNAGSRSIVARVEHRKRCSGLSGEREPAKRDYLVRPNRPIELRRVWSESSCEHEFIIVSAAYYVQRR